MRRYLAYAFGEVVLIVIGILIALGINNWNQDRITRQKERAYLMALKAEFADKLEELEHQMQNNRYNYQAGKQLTTFAKEPKGQISEAEFSRLFANSFMNGVQFLPESGVLSELISSGSLKDIQNIELRRFISSWDAKMANIRGQESEVLFYRQNCTDHMRRSGSMTVLFDQVGLSTDLLELEKSKSSASNLILLKSEPFKNDLLLFITTSQLLNINFYDPLRREIRAMQDLIEQELNP